MKPILLHNCETWGLRRIERKLIDAFHRQQLRKVLKIKYPYKISNKQLYEWCDSSQVSLEVTTRRWNALGHILSLPKPTPCWRSMIHYFNLWSIISMFWSLSWIICALLDSSCFCWPRYQVSPSVTVLGHNACLREKLLGHQRTRTGC